MKTCCFKLYKAKRNRKLHRQINAAGLIYNHCIALHKRSYRLYHKSLNVYALQKHLTKLKKMSRFSYLKEIGSQAVQDITQRMDRAYKLFFRNLKRKIHTAPPSFKKVRKYKSYTLKQAGWKLLEGNAIQIGTMQARKPAISAAIRIRKQKICASGNGRVRIAVPFMIGTEMPQRTS